MPTTVENIQEQRATAMNLVKSLIEQAKQGNSDGNFSLISATLEVALTGAAFEIAIQLAELNSKLDSVMGSDSRDLKRFRVM